MNKFRFPVLLSIAVVTASTLPAYAIDARPIDPQKQVAVIDTVVAVVNEDVITRHQLDEKIRSVVIMLRKQGIALPEQAELEKQVLERMINELLLEQYAKESGVRVEDAQLDLSMARVAQQNNFPSLSAFLDKLREDGVDVKKFREEMRSELLTSRIRQREVESKMVISDNEVDNYLSNKVKMGLGEIEYHLAHILVVVPEQASSEKIGAAFERANQALARLQGGADFAQVAAGFSDAKDALNGGDLGWRPGDRIPPLFLNELVNLQTGQNTAVLRSPSGFHILKLIEKRTGGAPVVITQTHARHILIKTSEIVSEAEARNGIMEILQRIRNGADFAEQAKRHSQDSSAQNGGDLDWLSPGQTVPEFEEAMNRLQVGEIGMVQTQFGWHLVKVIERRNTDVSVQQQRQQARAAIGSFKSEELWQDWQRQLRDRAFVEYHLEDEEQ